MRNPVLPILIFTVFLCISLTAGAQSTQRTALTGRVMDSSTGDPIAYATITLADTTMSPINAAAADMSGRFLLNVKSSGDYKLIVTYVGYTSAISDVRIEEGLKKLDLGEIGLSEGAEIEEISVVVQKPIIKVDPEKLTYSVEADPEADYSTLAEILRKVPQLSVDAEDNVLLNGQSDYKVLVNGKNSSMMAKNFKDVIKSMPANSIKEIEVITEPSTKYESEGVGGIINIVTTRKTMNGYSGRVGAGYSSFNSYNANAYLSGQIGKVNMSVNYWYNNYGTPDMTSYSEVIRYQQQNTHTTKTRGSGDGRGGNQGLSFEASYEIDTFNLVTMSFWGYKGNHDYKTDTRIDVFNDQGVPFSQYQRISDGDNMWGYLSGSLDYQRSFRKPDKTLTVSYKLESDPSKQERLSTILNYPGDRERSLNRATGTEHTVQVDYLDPIHKKHQIEAGLKYILRMNNSENEEKVWDDNTSSWLDNTVRQSVELQYTQHILGLYGGYLFKHEKMTAKAGFRMEGTYNTGHATTKLKEYKFDTPNFNIVPYVNFTYMLKPTQRLNASYTQRLRRPGIYHLNPYEEVNADNDKVVQFGNPDLKSVMSHSFSAGYSIFSSSWNLNLGASYNFSDNDITSYTRLNGDVMETTYDNIGKNRNLRLNLSMNYRLKTILSIYAGINGGYNEISAYVFDGSTSVPLHNSGFNMNGHMGANVTLWKDARFSANLGYFMSPVNLQGSDRHQYYTSFSLTQRFFKQTLDVSLSASNPFTKYQTYGGESGQEGIFKNIYDSKYAARRLQIHLGYRFGKMDVQVKKARRTISNDDKMGGGAGGGTGGGITPAG